MAVRILIVDDHEVVREGIRTMLGRSGRPWEICGEARNGREAVELIQELKPDLAILDITMPVMSGLEAAKKISRLNVDCKLLMFTMHDSSSLGPEARNAGADGYVLKAQAARDLIRAIECLLEGNTFFGAPAPKEKKTEQKPQRGSLLCSAVAFA